MIARLNHFHCDSDDNNYRYDNLPLVVYFNWCIDEDPFPNFFNLILSFLPKNYKSKKNEPSGRSFPRQWSARQKRRIASSNRQYQGQYFSYDFYLCSSGPCIPTQDWADDKCYTSLFCIRKYSKEQRDPLNDFMHKFGWRFDGLPEPDFITGLCTSSRSQTWSRMFCLTVDQSEGTQSNTRSPC